jgi:hypothetical protein
MASPLSRPSRRNLHPGRADRSLLTGAVRLAGYDDLAASRALAHLNLAAADLITFNWNLTGWPTTCGSFWSCWRSP